MLSALPAGHPPSRDGRSPRLVPASSLSLLALPRKQVGGVTSRAGSFCTLKPAPPSSALKHTEHPATGRLINREFGGRTKPREQQREKWVRAPPSPALQRGFLFSPRDGKRGWD